MSSTAPIRASAVFGSHRRQRGFALIELLVAFVILAIGLSAIFTGVAVAMRSDGRTQSTQIAFRLARSRLEQAGVTEALLPGYREGRMAGNYDWRETITAVHIGARPSQRRDAQPGTRSDTQPDAKSNARPGNDAGNKDVASYWVEVAVQAPDGTLARLAALKLASGAMP
jgi:prepilin-type N-terminal cleavage/methylation domain-containing protein